MSKMACGRAGGAGGQPRSPVVCNLLSVLAVRGSSLACVPLAGRPAKQVECDPFGRVTVCYCGGGTQDSGLRGEFSLERSVVS